MRCVLLVTVGQAIIHLVTKLGSTGHFESCAFRFGSVTAAVTICQLLYEVGAAETK